MSCDPELVSAFIDGELESVIIGSVTKHLLKCDKCCKTMGRMAMVQEAVSEKYALCYPEELTNSIMSAISNEKITQSHSLLYKRLISFGVPALLVSSLLSAPNFVAAETQESDNVEVAQSIE
ncbi:MAG: hypothetical protein HQL70_04150 [Magnetococcales bacterium]|nr:hypothetical protein [Magnetococcales bacterium]